MDGSTVVIAPPDGNMTEYINSLKLLEDYDIDYFAPGQLEIIWKSHLRPFNQSLGIDYQENLKSLDAE